MTMRIPTSLEPWHNRAGGSEWLASLPRIVEECAEQWGLTIGEPFEEASASFVTTVTTPGGDQAVLKVNFPERESECEPDALRHWAGQGAVALLASDTTRRALLIERCRPGTPLWDVHDDAEATGIWAHTTSRIWKPAPTSHPFSLLADEARRWASQLPQQFSMLLDKEERLMRDEAVEAIPELLAVQGKQVVLHQDLHGGNILQAEREPWLVIDPKPLVGEREFDTASFLRDRRPVLEGPDGASIVQRRLDMLAGLLGLDKQRMRLWGMVHALAWGFSGGQVLKSHVHAAKLIWRANV